MQRILGYMRPYLGRMGWQLAIKFIGTLMDLALPWILAKVLDEAAPAGDTRLILWWGGAMALCSVLALAFNIIANRMASYVARCATEQIRHDLFSRTVRLSCAQADHLTVPSLESRLTADTYNVHELLCKMQRMGVRAPILLLGGVLITLTLDIPLTLVLVALMPLIALVVSRISHKGVPLYTRAQRSVDRVVGIVRENVTGIRVIKALSKGAHERARFGEANVALTQDERRAVTTMALSNPLINLILNLGLVAVVGLGAWRVNADALTPGAIVAFLSYFTIILNAMLSITRIFVLWSKGSASAQRIDEVMSLPEDMPVIPAQRPARGPFIRFEHVSFSYENVKNDLTDIDFSLKKGQTLGVIGPTGCGKSTLAALLMRLYDVDAGRVLIGGEDVRAMDPKRLHALFGVVFQSGTLFKRSVRENIDFDRDLSPKEIALAADRAQAGFVREFEDGLDHPLAARGANLSGGQRQRLLIARALAADPDILVLDDASSALDYRTDSSLRAALQEGRDGVTTVVIAQRVSSIRHADLILVMDEGRIVGRGTHDALMASCPDYAEIAHSQMGGEIVD